MKIHGVAKLLLCIVLAVCLVPDYSFGQEKVDYSNLVGTWAVTVTSPRGAITSDWTFSLKDDKLVAAIQAGMGGRGGGRGGRTIEVTDIKFDGTKMSFTITRETQRGTVSSEYSAVVNGNTMKGKIIRGLGRREVPFTGIKKEKK